jgi:hypothetical protein
MTDHHIPTGVAEYVPLKAVTAGRSHCLALTTDGHVRAWGANDKGQLGDGTKPGQAGVGQIDELGHVVAVAAGGRHSLALDAAGIVPPDGGVVRGWGANESGQLGDGTTTDRSHAVNRQLEGAGALRGASAIGGGQAHSLASRRTTWRARSAAVVLQGAPARLAPPAPPAHPLDTASQQHRRHGQKERREKGRAEPVVGIGTEPPDRALLNDEPGQHRAGPEQRSRPMARRPLSPPEALGIRGPP